MKWTPRFRAIVGQIVFADQTGSSNNDIPLKEKAKTSLEPVDSSDVQL